MQKRIEELDDVLTFYFACKLNQDKDDDDDDDDGGKNLTKYRIKEMLCSKCNEINTYKTPKLRKSKKKKKFISNKTS